MLDAVTATGAGSAVDSLQFNCFSFFINASSVTTGGTVKIQGLTPAGDWVDISTTTVTADGDTLAQKNGAYLQVRANLTARTDGTYTVSMVAKEGKINEAAAEATSIVSTTDLVSFWKLDEASGTRVDAFGSNDLTDNNTVGQLTGITAAPYSTAADFEASNSEFFDRLNIADIDLATSSDQVTFAAWVKRESTGVNADIFDPYSSDGSANRGWLLRFSSTGKIRLTLGRTGANSTYETTSAVTATSWTHVLVQHETGDGSKTKIYVDGVEESGSWVSGTGNETPNQVTADLHVGVLDYNGIDYYYFDGGMQGMGVWTRLLSTAEIIALANKDDPFYDQF